MFIVRENADQFFQHKWKVRHVLGFDSVTKVSLPPPGLSDNSVTTVTGIILLVHGYQTNILAVPLMLLLTRRALG